MMHGPEVGERARAPMLKSSPQGVLEIAFRGQSIRVLAGVIVLVAGTGTAGNQEQLRTELIGKMHQRSGPPRVKAISYIVRCLGPSVIEASRVISTPYWDSCMISSAPDWREGRRATSQFERAMAPILSQRKLWSRKGWSEEDYLAAGRLVDLGSFITCVITVRRWWGGTVGEVTIGFLRADGRVAWDLTTSADGATRLHFWVYREATELLRLRFKSWGEERYARSDSEFGRFVGDILTETPDVLIAVPHLRQFMPRTSKRGP